MTYAERAEKRARAIYEAALSSTLMQQESTTAAGVVCESTSMWRSAKRS